MEILKELKKEARKLRKSKSEPASLELRLNEYSRSGSIDALNKTHEYLHEFIEQVYLACPDITFDYQIPEIGTLKDCTLTDYLLSYESTLKNNQVKLTVTIPHTSGISVEPAPAQKQLGEFEQYGVLLDINEKSLSLREPIVCTLLFSTTEQGADISFQVTNLETPGQTSWLLSPAHITDDFLDELGRYLLRKKHKLMELISEQPKKMSKEKDYDETENRTREMDVSRFQSLFNKEMRLYMTYHNDIKEITSKSKEFVIGRSGSCDLVINSDLASRQHAVLKYRKGKFIITDQSTNGTFIKSEGGKEMFLQGEESPITGSGFISLGKSVTVDNEHLIYFSCQ